MIRLWVNERLEPDSLGCEAGVQSSRCRVVSNRLAVVHHLTTNLEFWVSCFMMLLLCLPLHHKLYSVSLSWSQLTHTEALNPVLLQVNLERQCFILNITALPPFTVGNETDGLWRRDPRVLEWPLRGRKDRRVGGEWPGPWQGQRSLFSFPLYFLLFHIFLHVLCT